MQKNTAVCQDQEWRQTELSSIPKTKRKQREREEKTFITSSCTRLRRYIPPQFFHDMLKNILCLLKSTYISTAYISWGSKYTGRSTPYSAKKQKRRRFPTDGAILYYPTYQYDDRKKKHSFFYLFLLFFYPTYLLKIATKASSLLLCLLDGARQIKNWF